MIVTLKNFMSHDHTVFTLPDRGLVQVTGPNGAGKSALVEAFAIALWGRGARSLRWQPWRGEHAGSVELKDDEIRVERRWTGKAKGLRWQCGPAPNDVFDTTSKGQEALATIVGPFDVWRRTCVFSSSDAAHFTMATDAERKELLEDLLGLGWFDRALQACRKDLHFARTALGLTEHERDLLIVRMEGGAKLVRQSNEMLAETPDPGDVGLLRAQLAKVEDHLADTVKEWRDTEAAREELVSAGGEHKARAQELRGRLNRLVGAECYTCGQEIPQALRDSLEAAVGEAVAQAEADKAAVVGEVSRLREQAEDLRTDADALRGIAQQHRAKVTSITTQRELRTKLIGLVEQQGAAMLMMAEQLNGLRDRLTELAVDVAELTSCEQVLGVRGARTLLIGRTLSGIETLANTWMQRLGSTIRVQLRPYTEKKSGGTVDSISLTLIGAGGDSGYAGASAGERRRVDVALLLSLAELASGTEGGARWRSPIFFDEVFDSLDADGRDAVMGMVEGLAQDRLVVLITHDELVASARADLRLRVDGGQVT